MRIIDVIETYYDCKIVSVTANLRGGSKVLYKDSFNLTQLILSTTKSLNLDISDIAITLEYISHSDLADLSDNITFINEMIGCLLEDHEPWSLHEGLALAAKNSKDNIPLEIIIPQFLNTLICSHLFDKTAILFYNKKKQELRGVDIATIPPYSKENTVKFQNISIPISKIYIDRILSSNSPIIDNNSIFKQFDQNTLSNKLILAPIVISDQFYGLLITYSDNSYENKHIYATNSSAQILASFITASIANCKYKLSMLSEAELRATLDRSKNIQTLGNYANMLAHEIRNPLISIGGFSKRLLKVINDPSLQKMVRIISSEADRLEQLTTDLLSYAKKNALAKTNVSLYEELTASKVLFETRSNESNIDIIIDKSTDVTLYIDRNQFRQVVINLIVNSMNAIKQSGTIKFRCVEDNISYKLIVSDTGEGIPDSSLPNLFEPFFTTSEHGTGLGLAISKKIMLSHGGDIYVTNHENGAEFVLVIPKIDA